MPLIRGSAYILMSGSFHISASLITFNVLVVLEKENVNVVTFPEDELEIPY